MTRTFETVEVDGTYVTYCRACREKYRNHEVVSVDAGLTGTPGTYSCWPSGLPTTKRQCTTCKVEDGPWISADLVGGGY